MGSTRGATLLEFAIVFPLLMLLLVGIVEFGWMFAQFLDVRHGAREGARVAVVNFPEGAHPPTVTRTQANTTQLLDEACSRMRVASNAKVTFSSPGGVNDPVTVTTTATGDTLSGFIDWAMPSLTLSSTVVLHAEQESTWANTDVTLFPDGQPCP